MEKIINNSNLGEDSIKGGYFFPSSLLPSGTFSPFPNTQKYSTINKNEKELVATLESLKFSIKRRLEESGIINEEEKELETFLYEFTNLLIDYKDMRNYIFYGSANTELAYNLNFIIKNYPFKFLVSILKSTLNQTNSLLKIVNDTNRQETELFFSFDAIKDGKENFLFYDNEKVLFSSLYEVLDKNNKSYKVKKIVYPDYPYNLYTTYSGTTILGVNSYSGHSITTPSLLSGITLKLQTNFPHNKSVGDLFNIVNSKFTGLTTKEEYDLDGDYVVYQVLNANELVFLNSSAANKINSGDFEIIDSIISFPNGSLTNTGNLRNLPLKSNSGPFVIKLVLEGVLLEEELIEYPSGSDTFIGIIISPVKEILNKFFNDLTPLQKMLLSPIEINPNPWPRREITNNIQWVINETPQSEIGFEAWLTNPSFLRFFDEQEVDNSFSDLYGEYKIISALALDETDSNQIIRRMIPYELISELNDTENLDFQRFLLIAGWLFDQLRVYIKFLKYTHHINTSSFNQLSPEYYYLYASHYGIDLFNDKDLDLSKLLIKTEKGLVFENRTDENNSLFYKQTFKELEFERQKRFLLGLFYLYKSKGTLETIKKVVSLLGSPDGFFSFSEFYLSTKDIDEYGYYKPNFSVSKIESEDKVFVPNITYEVDTNYNINNSLPLVYKQRLNNTTDVNLRELAVTSNSNGAIDFQIENYFGKKKYDYAKFNEGEFCNLQNLNETTFANSGSYNLLPLTNTDKFFGIHLEYMIPKNGFIKEKYNNKEQVTIHLGSLFEIENTTFTLGKVNTNTGFKNYKLPLNYYALRTYDNYLNYGSDKDNRKFNIFERKILGTNSDINLTKSYIIARLEGEDIVIRARLKKKTSNSTLDIGERVCIFKNIFKADGLNHTIKLLYKPQGVELFLDYKFIEYKDWLDPTTNDLLIPFFAFEIPKEKIETCSALLVSSADFIGEKLPNNTLVNWDLLIGLPNGIDFFYKSIGYYKLYQKDGNLDFYNRDYINKLTGECYFFNVSNNNSLTNQLKIKGEFREMNVLIDNNFSYDYQNTLDYVLYSKSLNGTSNNKHYNRIQDFFNYKDGSFKNFAWSKTLHKDTEYKNFSSNKVFELYKLYSDKVITYNSLADFLELAEGKFRTLIRNFIPIVINLSEFGEKIKNSRYNIKKIKYSNIEKYCNLRNNSKNYLVLKVFEVIPRNIPFRVDIDFFTAVDLYETTDIVWSNSDAYTVQEIVNQLNTLTNTNYIKFSRYREVLLVEMDSAWLITNYGFNTFTLKFKNTPPLSTIIYTQVAEGYVTNPSTNCGSIEYKVPTEPESEFYYFANENSNEKHYTTFDSETTGDKKYISFNNE